MSSYRRIVSAAAFAVLGVCAWASFRTGSGVSGALLRAAVVMAIACGTYILTHRRSLIALGVSLIPASATWIFYISGSRFSMILGMVSLVTIWLVSRFADLPEARQSTDNWVGTLLTCEILLCTALAVFCGLL